MLELDQSFMESFYVLRLGLVEVDSPLVSYSGKSYYEHIFKAEQI